nr:reverse transcriptase domain-containing protein [Tanacetum cinerariifolium]
MRTRSNFYPSNSTATIPRRSNRRRIPNIVEPEFRAIEEIIPMADRTMEELLQAPTEGYEEAIVIPEILAENFEIKTNLLQLVQANKFHGFERDNPHTHISNFKRMTATLKYRDVLNDAIKLMLFPYLLEGAARIWDVVSKTNDRIDKLADQISNLVEIVNKQVIAPAKAVKKTCVTCGGAHAYYDCIATDSNQPSVCVATGSYNQVSSPNRVSHQIPPPGFALNQPSTSGTLPSNTVPNPKGEMKAATTRSGLACEGPSIPTDSPLEKVDEQNTEEILDKEHSNSSGSTVSLNENCSAMLLKKLPEKLEDPELTPTRMTLELADRSITRPKGVAEDVFVKVGKFHFLTDFVVVDFEADPSVPLILGRSFLRTGCALIDVYGEEITLRVNDESYNPKSSSPTLVSDVSVSENDVSKEPILLHEHLLPLERVRIMLKTVKNQAKPGNIGHEIESLHQTPDQRAFFYKDQANEAKCIWFVVRGQVRSSKTLTLHHNSYPPVIGKSPMIQRDPKRVKCGDDEKKELLVESRVLIPETTFVDVESRVLIPEMTFVGVESRSELSRFHRSDCDGVFEDKCRKFNFLKYIFDNLVRNVDSSSKFYMYPRFLQLMIAAQVGELSSHNTKYTSSALTQKVFANMRRVGKGFSGVNRLLFKRMLVPQQVNDDVADVVVVAAAEDENAAEPTPLTPTTTPPHQHELIPSTSQVAPTLPPSPHQSPMAPPSSPPQQQQPSQTTTISMDLLNTLRLKKKNKLEPSCLKRLRKVGTAQRVESSADTVVDDQEDAEPAEFKKVIEVVTTAKLMIEVVTTAATTITDAPITAAPSAARRRKGVVIRDPEETSTPSVKRKAKHDNAILRYQALKRKPQTKAHAKKNMMVYMKNMAGFKMDFFKGMSYDDIRPIFEKHFNSIVGFLAKNEKELEEEASKAIKRKSKSSKEKAVKKQKLDEEVEELKTHLQIVSNDEDDVYTKATPSALKIVQERFASSKPKNFSNDFLLNTLKKMFEKPNVEDQVWKNQRGNYGLAKVKSWKLLESCGVYIITFTTTQMILLVERKYPLTRFTLDQMLNNVRLEVKEESEVSLELLRFVRRQQQEGYKPE